MSILPGDLATIAVTATYPDASGTPLVGYQIWQLTSDLVDSTGNVIIRSTPIRANYVGGKASISLVCNDDPTLSPQPSYYTVTEYLNGVKGASGTYQLLRSMGATVDLADLVQVTPGQQMSTQFGVLASPNTNTWLSSQIFDGAVDIEGALTFGGVHITAPPNDSSKVLTGAGTWVAPGGASGALLTANNLSELSGTAATARSNLGLGSAATANSSAFDAAGAAAAAQTNALAAVGAETTRAQNAEAAKLTTANNLSELAASPAAARGNLGLGSYAQQNAGSATGVLAEMLPAHQCATSGGSPLSAAVLILNLIRPTGPITVTNLGIWLTLAGVTASGANGLALYTEAGVLIDQTADLSTAFATAGFLEAPLSLGTYQTTANTNYYIGVLAHFSGTTPKAATAVAGQTIPVIKGHYLSLTKSATATFPASFTPSGLSISTAAYYVTMS